MSELLFVYGTLQYPAVQQRIIGRTVSGRPDTLPNFQKSRLGEYFVAVPAAGQQIKGMVLTVTPDELTRMDYYEGDAYQRVRVSLGSGLSAWVYRNRPYSRNK